MSQRQPAPEVGLTEAEARDFIVEAISWAETTDDGRVGGERAEALLAAHEAHIKADAARQALLGAADSLEWAGADEDYQAFRDWLRARADRLNDGSGS